MRHVYFSYIDVHLFTIYYNIICRSNNSCCCDGPGESTPSFNVPDNTAARVKNQNKRHQSGSTSSSILVSRRHKVPIFYHYNYSSYMVYFNRVYLFR